MAPQDRHSWLDANRSLAALGIVMIHSTTDIAGRAFSAATEGDRVVPIILRQVGEISSTELFMLFSLFLIADKLMRDPALPYWEMIKTQAKRLLVPFIAWTILYAFFRLMKAYSLGYEAAIWTQLGDLGWWVRAFLLGSSHYHMHFLPTLFAIILMVPMLRLAHRWPALGLALIGCVAMRQWLDGQIWSMIADPEGRAYALRAVKIMTYLGYGWAAFAIWQVADRLVNRHQVRDLRWAVVALLILATLVQIPAAWQVIGSGQWGPRAGLAHAGHFLTAPLVLLFFASFKFSPLPAWVGKTALLTFGIYLVHPAWIDGIDVLLMGMTLSPTVMVAVKFTSAALLSAATTWGLSQTRFGWLVGLGAGKGQTLRLSGLTQGASRSLTAKGGAS